VVNPLSQADNAFDAGNYSEAARAYERYLQIEPNGNRRDEALFRLALALALPSSGNADWTRITALLKELVDRHPASSYRAPALLILTLQSDALKRDQRIKQLSTELDKLKQIDAERRRRP
jgi:outer membrane protein assembly factor BamD (BamD/ComL family)